MEYMQSFQNPVSGSPRRYSIPDTDMHRTFVQHPHSNDLPHNASIGLSTPDANTKVSPIELLPNKKRARDGGPAPKITKQGRKKEHSEHSMLGRLLKDSSSWKRTESKFVQTQPLYQDYWMQCTKDGTLSVESSITFNGILSSSFLGGSSGTLSPHDYTTSLWQELPEVKEHGIADGINVHQLQLQEPMTSEASYQRSLTVAICHFQNSRKLSECLVSTEKHTLFSNLPGVRVVYREFLLDLEDGLEKDVFLHEIGNLVLQHCPDFHRVYVPYVTNQMYQDRLIKQLVHSSCNMPFRFLYKTSQENRKFLQVLQKLEEQSVCKRQPLKSFLVLPFQRITRLRILLENILKLAHDSPELASSVGKALATVGQIVSGCNEGVRSMIQTEELVLLEKRVDFVNLKSFPLISRGRVLLQHGELAQILFKEVGVVSRPCLSTKPIYLHLFSDLLLLSNKTEHGRFMVTDYASKGQVQADNLKAKALGLPDLAFLLRLSCNHAGISREVILKASNKKEMQYWISVITSHMLSESNC
ncbi:rho guanine nucleotide exchange factor 19-like [Pelobates cultripes]|uniref:Rho guanine nucleotide exchange factor 19-like n=1 Tax=Pelobates cultripes TaxID=61616 RepID=A0AAD1T6F3_PELCU|nr:rho guanine nucleotide exchange factor 19-like [Pelobates cultripes]